MHTFVWATTSPMTKLDDIILKLHYSANNRQFAKTERKGAEPV